MVQHVNWLHTSYGTAQSYLLWHSLFIGFLLLMVQAQHVYWLLIIDGSAQSYMYLLLYSMLISFIHHMVQHSRTYYGTAYLLASYY